jgi:transcriptional regulator with XRE-family HTH domain
MLARIEAAKVTPRIATLERIASELERRGVEFLNGRGVILKQPEQSSPTEAESATE